MISKVEIIKSALKQAAKAPIEIQESLHVWIDSVEEIGLAKTNARPGFNAEHLSGNRKGQRSIRLNRAWRAIYTVVNGDIQIVTVEEVTKHKY